MANGSISFDNLTLLIGIITGIFLSLISLFTWICLRKETIKLFFKKHQTEAINYYFSPGTSILLITQFFIGVFWGGYIIPFFIFKNVEQIKMVTANNLHYYIILGIFSIICLINLGTYCVILTNKRITGTCLVEMKIFKPLEILLSDIKDIRIKKTGIEIISKNNLVFPIVPKKEAMLCLNKIQCLLIGGTNNDR